MNIEYRYPFVDAVYDRDFSAEQRSEASAEGQAMPGGGFPIKSEGDVRNAIRAIGRAKNPAAARRFIKKRARALGVSRLIPEGWGDSAGDIPVAAFQRDALPLALTSTTKGSGIVSEPLVQMCDSGGVSKLTMYDTIELDDTDERFKPVETRDGFIKAMPRIARAGIQLYRGRECQRDDMDIVRVYRPPEAVFATDAVKSYTHLPVTLDHPPVPVTADNWKRYATGETGEEVLRDGQAARVPMMMRDAAAIKAWKAGHRQLSVGYDCDLNWTPGVTDSGEPYDCFQVPGSIRANHLAQVVAARGGPTLNIGDNNREGDTTMTLKTLTIDGFECQMTDQSASIVQRLMRSMTDQIEAFKKKAKEQEEDDDERDTQDHKKDEALKAKDQALAGKDQAIAAANKVVETKDGEIAGLKKQLADAQAELTPAKIDARVKDRLLIVQRGKGILGDALTCDGKTDAEIRKAVVVAKVGDSAKDWSDDKIAGAFDTLAVTRPNEFMRAGGNQQRDSIDAAIVAFGGAPQGGLAGRPGGGYSHVSPVDKAYLDYDQDITNAWRGGTQNNNNNRQN